MEPRAVQIYRSIILIIVVVTLIMTFTSMPSRHGLYGSAPLFDLSRLTYHFYHGGLLHWAVNAAALLTIAFRFQIPWWQYAVALAVACIYPFGSSVPVIGLSVWIYAVIGIMTPVTTHPFRVISINMVCIMSGYLASIICQILSYKLIINHTIPVIAWQAHMYAYISGIIIGLVTQPVWRH